MALQILLNFVLAFAWMFITASFTPSGFAIGFILGLLLVILMRRFFSHRLYLSRVWAIISLTVLFLKELVLSSFQVFRIVIRPNLNLSPAIFELETELTNDWEVTLLSALITLTPGTLVVGISEDQTRLYIHALEFDNVEESVDSIRNTFEKAIREVSRP
ncbi:Na+/H+ antiporter subunit E [Planomicrobium sp. YIM 101495]|uniref:Na+/H+ antiporter subunit E n=1 Tax=Planomicrobium sp. YIM 101495 TaxID=2665160 RepID=UPI0012B720A5|nr:Na+/H+ antiporter subunit E [Planomicrobium sp. YIM 101495]MTD31804.1 Na+/H+ antiporter subunit E [Planomicrobium sp. YIM 101495]